MYRVAKRRERRHPLMRRFITLATIAVIVAAVVKQRQRVKELGRQVLSERTAGNQWQRVQGLTRQVLSRGTTEEIRVSAEENKATQRRVYEEAFNQKNLDVLDELIASEFTEHNPNPGQPPGLEGLKQFLSSIHTAFPDLHVNVEDMVAEGDKVAARLRVRGTHQGEFTGIAPTGNQVTLTGIDIVRIAEGKVVEHWGNFDNLGMMRQLGAIPESGDQPS
jgi:steroid delta-isomerase-like uncharacterized protein